MNSAAALEDFEIRATLDFLDELAFAGAGEHGMGVAVDQAGDDAGAAGVDSGDSVYGRGAGI